MSNLMNAIQILETGDPTKLKYVQVQKPTPGPKHVLVRNHAVGVNYIDTYHRTGLYKIPLPAILGREGAGEIAEVGSEVSNFKVGDRVTYFSDSAYADYTAVPNQAIVKIPDDVSFDTACALVIQGMTAHYLVASCVPTVEGQTVLIHAAAGGTGQALVQISKALGARVIATASTEEKREIAKRAGADEVVDYTDPTWPQIVRGLTRDGAGVDVVFDGVGKATFNGSLEAIKIRGYMITFGNASGKVDPFELLRLSEKSISIQRPTLVHFTRDPKETSWRMESLYAWLKEGKLRIDIGKAYPLKDAHQAHTDLESRITTGKLILHP